MLKIIKYRLLSLMEDKIFVTFMVLFFMVLNYNVLVKSGLLSVGSGSFNEELKYALLINTFTIFTSLYGLIITIYMAHDIISRDIKSGQIYITLLSFSNRGLVILGQWLCLVGVVLCFLFLIIINFLSLSFALDITVNYYDVILAFKDIFLNMIVLITLTVVASIIFQNIFSFIVPLTGLVLFNVYTYSNIPFANQHISLSNTMKSFLATLIPIKDIAPPSLVGTKYTSFFYVETLLLENINTYQILYVLIVLILGIVVFSRKDL